jgi:hypothetical protein
MSLANTLKAEACEQIVVEHGKVLQKSDEVL